MRTIWTGAALGAATLAAFWPVLHNGFIGLDDKDYVVYNARVTGGLSWQNVAWAFQTGSQGNWHPLAWLSHMLDVHFFGLAPAGHHLTSLLLHTANALLLFLLLWRLTDAHWRSAFVAALFALHPLHVESVAWVAERKDVLSTFFFLLTLLSYVRYVRTREAEREDCRDRREEAQTAQGAESPAVPPRAGPRDEREAVLPGRHTAASSRSATWYGVTLALFVLGLMSKAMVVTLPGVLLLLDYWPLGRLENKSAGAKPNRLRPLLAEKLPFFALAAGASILALLTQASAQAVVFRLSFASRLANAIASYWKYLGKMLWPFDLALYYPLPKALHAVGHPCLNWRFGVAAFALAALSFGIVLLRRRRPWLGVGWFWYLGTLVPVIGLIQIGGQAMADRYTYIPLIGIFICIAWGATDLATRLWPAPALGLALPGSGAAQPGPAFGVRGLARLEREGDREPNRPDRPELRLQTGGGTGTCAAEAPPNAAVSRTLQAVLAAAAALVLGACVLQTRIQVSYWRDTLTVFERTLAVSPDNAPAHFLVASELGHEGDVDQALAHFRATLRANPAHIGARCSLGMLLESTGHPDQAAEQYEAGLEFDPRSETLHNRLGFCLWTLGRREPALQHYAEALRLQPNFPEAQLNLANALADLGRWDAAVPHFNRVIELDPANVQALSNLGEVLVKLGRPAEAEARFEAAVRLCPTNVEAHINLGTLLWRGNERDLAVQHFAEAARLAPRQPLAFFNLGVVLCEQGKLAQAIAQFKEALRLAPDYLEARTGLGRALAAAGKFEEAQDQFRQALQLCPTNAGLHLSLAQTLIFLGQTNQAMTAFAEARRLKPGLPAQSVAEGKALAARRQFTLACARFNTALWLEPQNVEALDGLAWILATNPQAPDRDGPAAVRLSERACQLTEAKNPEYLATLAAAYAEAGRFAEAASTAEKARDLALAGGQRELAQTIESGLARYRNQQPFHQ